MTRGELRRVIDEAHAAGFTVEPTRGGHWRVVDADGHTVTTFAKTPSCCRAWLNARASIRRAARALAEKKGRP